MLTTFAITSAPVRMLEKSVKLFVLTAQVMPIVVYYDDTTGALLPSVASPNLSFHNLSARQPWVDVYVGDGMKQTSVLQKM